MGRTAAQDAVLIETLDFLFNSRLMDWVLTRSNQAMKEHETASLSSNLSIEEHARIAQRAARAKAQIVVAITICLVIAKGILLARAFMRRYGMLFIADLLWLAFGQFVFTEVQATTWFHNVHIILLSAPFFDMGVRFIGRRVIERQKHSRTGLYAGTDDAFLIRANRIIDVVSFFVPRRIAKEDLGDLLEDVRIQLSAGEDRSKVAIRVAIAIGYAGLSSLKYFLSPLVAILKLIAILKKW
jgi:hypothetical protein